GERHVYSLDGKHAGDNADGRKCVPLDREPVRSRLRAKDTALLPPFETFMDQEISAQEETCRNLIKMFNGGSDALRTLGPCVQALTNERAFALRRALDDLLDQYDDDVIRERFYALADGEPMRWLLASLREDTREHGAALPPSKLADRLESSEAGFLADLLPMARTANDVAAVRLLDVMLERGEVSEFGESVGRFLEVASTCLDRGGRIYVVCCGSSFHAAKAACLFFNEMACTELIPIIPGEFRGQYSESLRDGDLFIAVSQSGETKDLIDVLNFILASGRDIQRVALVNNVNSTLAQEKSNLVIPLRCGPEIAVPATKSFMNQMALFYCLALRLGQRRLPSLPLAHDRREHLREDLELRTEKLLEIPLLIRGTVQSTEADVDQAAQLLYLCPSMHILATRITAVAKEGALKVREVVLNHTEGFEGSEFKHGPNTILGINTVYGPVQLDALLMALGRTLETLVQGATLHGMKPSAAWRLVQASADAVFRPTDMPFSLAPNEKRLFDRALDRQAILGQLYADYPLVYVTGPDDKDVNLTISQINTHKIRGASTVVIAEEQPQLRGAATKAPADNPTYKSVYIALPRTNDTLMTVFSATVVLQRLALKMSLLKMQYLDRLGIKDHGVHPDVPKNVSKSITVD
ncbi:MAG: SIS domain-containing protein, partial [Polyangiaceae bacterium]|nr:SIS domain-containing protein [Polyangiaceae bacterium]